MNIQPKKSGKPDAVARLVQLWGLTKQNAKLARSYLTEAADDSLLSGAERQVFAPFDWQERQEICSTLQEVTAPEYTKNQAKVLKLLWAIGRSTAGFAALFGQENLFMVSDDAFRQRCEVLGVAAAAAMDAEYPAAHPSDYDQTRRLHQLARTDPDVLLEAQRLIADPQNSMAGGVLAGVLLAAGPKEAKGDAPLARQVELVLNRVEAILTSEDNSLLSDEDISQLKAYLRAGDPTVPVPATSFPNIWHISELDYLSRLLVSVTCSSAVKCIAPAVLFGLGCDSRLACAMRVLAGLDLCGVLWGTICFLPEDWEMDALDTLLPHIPGGGGTLLRFVVIDFYEHHEEAAQKLAHHFRAAGEEILDYLNLEEYERLGALLPELKHSRDSAWMEALRGVITPFMEKLFCKDPKQQDIVRNYLAGQGAFADSAALLSPIRNEYRYLSNIDEALQEYQKLAGWDDFVCRCMVLFCLTCAGNGTSKPLSTDGDKKRSMDAFVDALIARGLPVRDCMSVLTLLHQSWYERSRELLEQVVREHFATPAGLEDLGDAALNSSVTARVMAVEGLDALSSRPDCAERAREVLIRCSGDTSKQVQEVLVERYISHPDWEKDYLTMLSSKKAAQRSLAIRVLAGIGVGKYRNALENALAGEKNTKVADQITTLLGTPAAAVGAGGQTPAELAAQVLKGGKKRKVQWLLDQPLLTVHRTDEVHTAASEDQIAALFVAYADLGGMGRSDTADAIAADLNGKELEVLACEVWELGITEEELADRIVPTLDFAPDGTRVFDYGPRKFIVRLTPSLELAVTTEAGKAVRSMPSPSKADDAEKAPAAYAAYKALKKQIKTTITAQRARLEMALINHRCWDSEAWRKLFVENPVMHQFAISLIWGVYESGKLKETFRYMEDGSFNTADEEEYTLPDGGNIGLVHPIELEADTLAVWKQQLEDYEIIQSIDQLSRPVYRLPAEQAQAAALETVAGRVLNSLSLMSKLQSMGWYRGNVVDGGGFFTFYREDPSAGIGVELNFSGSFVGGENGKITVFDAVFYKAGTVARGSYCYDVPEKENVFPLGQVPARYYSEVVWQLERATASSTETDPDWRCKKN